MFPHTKLAVIPIHGADNDSKRIQVVLIKFILTSWNSKRIGGGGTTRFCLKKTLLSSLIVIRFGLAMLVTHVDETVLWIRSTDPMKGIDPMLNQLNYFLWIVSGQHSHISLNFRLFCIGKYKWSCYFYSIDIQLIQYAIETFILHFTALKAWRQFDVFINARSMRV